MPKAGQPFFARPQLWYPPPRIDQVSRGILGNGMTLQQGKGMAGWHEGYLEANGLRFHYIRTGRGEKAALLLLHGLTDYGRYWSPTASVLEDRFDVIILDQRGHGLSSRAEQGYTAEEMAEDAAAVIHGLGIAPASLLGHSLGASVAIALAARHPDLVSRILLLDPPLRQPTQELEHQEQRRRMEGWAQAVIEEQQLSLSEVEARCRERSPSWTAEDCRYMAEARLQVDPEAVRQFRVQRPWREELRRITCPTLLMYGDRELGSIVDHALAAEVARLAPNVRLTHISGAGHSAQRERFDTYIAAVRAFLG